MINCLFISQNNVCYLTKSIFISQCVHLTKSIFISQTHYKCHLSNLHFKSCIIIVSNEIRNLHTFFLSDDFSEETSHDILSKWTHLCHIILIILGYYKLRQCQVSQLSSLLTNILYKSNNLKINYLKIDAENNVQKIENVNWSFKCIVRECTQTLQLQGVHCFLNSIQNFFVWIFK